jgi:hypothetical protein
MSINGGVNSVNNKKKKKKKDIQSNPEIESKWNAERPKPVRVFCILLSYLTS